MNINPGEEKMIRVSASKIAKMLKSLKAKYSVKDDQDLLAMCALQLCVRLERSDFQTQEAKQQIIDEIRYMNQSISDII